MEVCFLKTQVRFWKWWCVLKIATSLCKRRCVFENAIASLKLEVCFLRTPPRLCRRMCVFEKWLPNGEYAGPLKCARIPHHSAIGRLRIPQYCKPPLMEIATKAGNLKKNSPRLTLSQCLGGPLPTRGNRAPPPLGKRPYWGNSAENAQPRGTASYGFPNIATPLREIAKKRKI